MGKVNMRFATWHRVCSEAMLQALHVENTDAELERARRAGRKAHEVAQTDAEHKLAALALAAVEQLQTTLHESSEDTIN